ncbi:GAF domain-containing protein [Kocuria flava]|uniref:GAF domain-containing protein n=1 Tax=Kocuria flava TaxID=446860 RepID=UPI003F1CA549
MHRDAYGDGAGEAGHPAPARLPEEVADRMGAAEPRDELVAALTRLHAMLLEEPTAPGTLEQLTRITRRVVPAADAAGVSTIDADGTTITTAATDPVVETADALQYDLEEGPCLSAWASAGLQRLEDTAADTRWPAWSAAARDLGIRSVLSAPLVHGGETLGALKVYAREPAVFSAVDEHLLALVAGTAAALLAGGRRPTAPPLLSSALHEVLSHRQLVDRATGVLMERHRTGAAAARRRLEEAAVATGRTPEQVAGELLGEHGA